MRHHATRTFCAIGAIVFAAVMGSAGATGVAAAGTGDWPMFGDGAAHDSVNRAETTLTPANVSGLHVAHQYPGWTENQADTVYQVVVGNLGYSVIPGTRGGANTFITAFKLPSGSRAWRHQISSYGHSGNYVPAVANGVLYVGGDSAVYAFDATTGAAVWSTTLAGGAEEVTVSGGMVYAGTSAFNASNGHLIWTAAPSGCCLTGAITVAGGVAYIADNQKLFAYNATTGAHLFTSPAAGFGDTVAVSAGVVFLQSAHDLQAFNASTGAVLWTKPTEGGNSVSSLTPAVDGSTVVVGTTRYLIAFAASNGARLWTYNSGSDLTEYLPPAIANGVVYAGSIGIGLQAFSEAHGTVLYTNRSACWSAIVSHGEVYAPCTGGETVWSL